MKPSSILCLLIFLLFNTAAIAQNGFDWYTTYKQDAYFFAKDSTAASYTWDFGDGSAVKTGNAEVTHMFPSDNKLYLVTLTQKDSNHITKVYKHNVGVGTYENSTIPDTIPPVVWLKGQPVRIFDLTFGPIKYVDEGAEVIDARDGKVKYIEMGTLYSSFPDSVVNIGGLYSVKYMATDKAGNKSYSEIRLILFEGTPISIAPQKELLNVQIYPNPANDKLNITLPENAINRLQINLLDINGRKVLAVPAHQMSKRVEINTASIPGGMYLLEFLHSEGRMVKPVSIGR